MKQKKIGLTIRLLAIIAALLLVVSVLQGVLLMNQSGSALRTLIRSRMLDISNTAAAMLDGDALEKLTADDEQTEPYQQALDALRVFQDNIDLKYIYAVRKVGEREFVFTVDPTVKDPASFGQAMTWTQALETASTGVACVDEAPYTDDWGRFYSAYSPVFDSGGRVAGIVGVDFSAEWYDAQIARYMRIIVVGSGVILIGVLALLVITGRIGREIRHLNADMLDLGRDVESLAHEIRIPLSHGYPARATGGGRYTLDEIGELSEKLRATQRELQEYVNYVHGQAYTDPTTGAGNNMAYKDAVKRLSGKISTNMADFSIVVFDVNGLKTINDHLGHEVGDQLLRDAAAVLQKVFGADRVYRIGGDEFLAVLEGMGPEAVGGLFAEMDAELAAFNGGEKRYEMPLSISRGTAAYERGRDKQFRDIFRRADEAMYRDKNEFYRRNGGSRKDAHAQ